MGPYDTTIRVKFTLSTFPSLGEASALASHLKRFGRVDEGAVVLSIKPKKSSKKSGMDEGAPGKGQKVVNAVIPFAQIGSAFAVISSGPALKEQGMEVSWIGGSEPPILGWLRDRGELGGKPKGTMPSTTPLDANGRQESRTDNSQSTKFSTFPSTFPTTPPPEPAKSSSTLDFESMTLLRLREAERARLEREILEAEARGDA
ncbi:hypothetical protein JVU11DRAFT_5696 [Chiua virens]|nr:hypothetical protein JVU11DRAFT_5696 [Chiua virens]